MYFNYDAKHEEYQRYRFAPPSHILGFVLLVCFTLVVFFPKETLLRQVKLAKKPSVLTANYLHNILVAYPEKNLLRLLLIEQRIKLGQLAKAQKELDYLFSSNAPEKIQDKGHWLSYEIIRARMYATTKPERRKQYQQQLSKSIHALSTANLTPNQLLQLANDAAGINQAALTRKIYQKLSKMKHHTNSNWFQQSALIAMQVGDYNNAAEFYFLAQRYSKKISQQRRYFMAGLRSLQQSNQMVLAIKAAQKHVANLRHDKATLLFLTRLALAANRPKLAQNYITQALQLRYGVSMHEQK